MPFSTPCRRADSVCDGQQPCRPRSLGAASVEPLDAALEELAYLVGFDLHVFLLLQDEASVRLAGRGRLPVPCGGWALDQAALGNVPAQFAPVGLRRMASTDRVATAEDIPPDFRMTSGRPASPPPCALADAPTEGFGGSRGRAAIAL